MKFLVISAILCTVFHLNQAGPLRLQKRAAFYIANETACVVDNTVYNNGDPIPTDDPCEACRCRPPGFACMLKDCESKPGCRAVRRAGQCCPDYICDSDNSTNVDYAFSTEKAHSTEETSNTKISEPTAFPEIPENIATKENDKVSSEVLLPESLDPSLLFSVNSAESSNQDVQITKKEISTESVSDIASEETSFDAESSEESSSEKQIETVTELLKTGYEILNDEEKPKAPEVSPDQGESEVGVGSETSAVTDKNVEIFPVTEESTTTVSEFKTTPPSEVTGQTTVSSTTVLPDSFEDADDKANELIKRLRSLKNLTSDDVTESPKENVDVKDVESKDATTKEATEIVATSVVTENPPPVKLEKEIIVEDEKEDVKTSDATTEAVSTSDKLYYNSDAKAAPVTSVETVTTVVVVKEPTSSEKVETSSPAVSSEPEQAVFKALSGVAEANSKQETTVESVEAAASQAASVEISDSTTPKAVDASTSSTLPPTTEKSGDKAPLYADETKPVPTTESPKVSEVESKTTVVAEISSEKVEPSKD